MFPPSIKWTEDVHVAYHTSLG